jgi:hypothetical protein
MEKRKLLLSIMVVGMFSAAALAIAPMGPPVAGLAQDQWAAGLGYAYSEMTLEISGPFTGTAFGASELDDVQSNIFYGCVGYGISDTWSAYVALGMADAEFDADNFAPPEDDFDGSSEFGFAVGTKRTLHDNGSGTKWGMVFQYWTGESNDKIAYPSTYGNGNISASSQYKLELDWYEIQLALGPAVQVNEDLCLYGGPFLHFCEGDLEAKSPGGSRTDYELEQLWELGGYIGAVLNVGNPNAMLSAELLFTGEGWGAGVGALFPF